MIKFILLFIVLIYVVAFVRTWQIQHNSQSAVFLKGTVPIPAPEGLYHGSVPGYPTLSWLGKKFNAKDHIGINLFQEGNKQVEKYPFKTSIGKGLQDKTLDVLRIDYDIPENPFWLRWIVDEIVQVAPGSYLGKLNLRLPGYTAAILYFELKK